MIRNIDCLFHRKFTITIADNSLQTFHLPFHFSTFTVLWLGRELSECAPRDRREPCLAVRAAGEAAGREALVAGQRAQRVDLTRARIHLSISL